MPNQLKVRWAQFGVFEINLETGELKKHGVRVRLQGKPFQILQALLECPGEVVTREELRRRLWPADTFVDFESGLNTAANRLRLTLGDSAEHPRYIETLARSGYRFIAPVTEVLPRALPEPPRPALEIVAPQPVPQLPSRRRLWMAGTAAILALLASVYLFWPKQPLPEFHQLTFGQGPIPTARFGPDGQTILYTSHWEGQPVETFTVRVGSPESRGLDLQKLRLASVSRSGELAVITAGPEEGPGWPRLARVPLNGRSPRPVSDRVLAADWIGDTDAFAVVRLVGNVQVVEFPLGREVYRSRGWITHLRVSPNGESVAFLDHTLRGDDSGVVKMIDRHGVNRTLSAGWSSLKGLAWNPSGSEVWFAGAHTGVRRAIYAVSLGGKLRTVASMPGILTLYDISPTGRVLATRDTVRMMVTGTLPDDPTPRSFSWFDWPHAEALSADGKLLLFSESGEGGGAHYAVYLRNLETGATIRVGQGLGMALSPDNQSALTLDPKTPGVLTIVPLGAGQPRALFSPGLEYQWARYFPDGRNLLVAGSLPGQGPRLFVQSVADGKLRPLEPSLLVDHPLIAPDGKWIAGVAGEQKIMILPVGGGAPRTLALKGMSIPVHWSQDGRTLLVQEFDVASSRIMQVDLVSGQSLPWPGIEPLSYAAVGDIHGVLFNADATSYVYSHSRTQSELWAMDGWK